MEIENNLKKEKKILFSLIAIAWLVFLGLVVFLGWPLTKKMYSSKDELEEGKLKLNSIKTDLSQKGKYQDLRQRIGESKLLLEKAVLKESTIVGFIEDLESTAQQTGNSIKIEPYTPPKKTKKTTDSDSEATSTDAQTNPTANAANSDDKKSYFKLTITGNYNQLLHFLGKMENMGYVFNFESLETKTRAGVNNVSFRELQAKAEETNTGNDESVIIISFSLQK